MRIYRGRFGTNWRITVNPTDFIRKHITAALTAEGFSPSVVQGGARDWSITAACRSQPKRGVALQIVYIAPVSGLLGRQPPQNGKRQRKSRDELMAFIPACSDCCYAKRIKSTLRGKFMKNHFRHPDCKSRAGEPHVSRNRRY